MFGYRLVPLALFDVMLAALQRAPTVASPVAPVSEPATVPDRTPSLSLEVEAACTRFAFGDRAELTANRALARHLVAAGYDDRATIAAIQAGGSPPLSVA